MDAEKFQWKRVGMLFNLYYPTLRWQIYGYLLLSLAVTGLMALGQRFGHVMFPVTVCSFILGLAYYLAPISITRRDYRPVSCILPVTAGEKTVFLLLYFGVGTYLLLYLPYMLMQLIFPDAVPSYQTLSTATGVNEYIDFGAWTYFYSFFSAFAMIPVVLWALVSSKTSRAAMVFAAYVVTTIAESMVGGAVGFVYALTHLDEMNSPEDIFNVVGMIKLVLVISAVMMVILISVFIPLLYRKLKTRGF